MGETCGMKLVDTTTPQPNKCKYCEKVDTKLRKREAECERIARWQREGRNPTSIEKSLATIAALDKDIQQLYLEISNRRQAIGGQSQRQPQPAYSSSNNYSGGSGGYGGQYGYAQTQYA